MVAWRIEYRAAGGIEHYFLRSLPPNLSSLAVMDLVAQQHPTLKILKVEKADGFSKGELH